MLSLQGEVLGSAVAVPPLRVVASVAPNGVSPQN